VAKLHADIVEIVKSPELTDRLTRDGAEVIANTPDEFARFIREEIDRYALVIKASGLRAE
jgi:tripartite-type tricarboxylate transporter receptor subunit TctC